MPDTIQDDILGPLLKQYPDSPTLMIARMAYRDNSQVWPNLEACRTAVRYRRGNTGSRCRKKRGNKSHFRPNQQPTNLFAEIPEGFEQIHEFQPYPITKPGDYLILADVHVPYHNRDALIMALESVKDPTGIILNGDFTDAFSLSRWETDPRERDFPYEVACTKSILETIRVAFPKAGMYWLHGNHEQRYERYMQLKAPELLGLPCFEWEQVYDCASQKIRVIKDCRPIRLGKLNVIHGHEYKFAISNPVNPARGLFLRAKTNTICSHFHQPSHHSENTLDDKRLTCWSTGCLCDAHPKYMPLNRWGLGFAIVTIDEKGAFGVQNKRIIDGKVYA